MHAWSKPHVPLQDPIEGSKGTGVEGQLDTCDDQKTVHGGLAEALGVYCTFAQPSCAHVRKMDLPAATLRRLVGAIRALEAAGGAPGDLRDRHLQEGRSGSSGALPASYFQRRRTQGEATGSIKPWMYTIICGYPEAARSRLGMLQERWG